MGHEKPGYCWTVESVKARRKSEVGPGNARRGRCCGFVRGRDAEARECATRAREHTGIAGCGSERREDVYRRFIVEVLFIVYL